MISKQELRLFWAKLVFNFRRLRLKAQFRRHMGYWGDLDNPQTYAEKVQFRKIYGNFPFYARVADKYRVREYIREKGCEKYLVPLLGVHGKLEPGVFRDLPASFVVKPSHGSGWKKIVFDKGRSSERETINYINRRLRKRYSVRHGEYHYDLIEPNAMIEELIIDEGHLPWNYCYFCFNGSFGFFHFIAVTSPDRKIIGRYHSDWSRWESDLSEEEEKKFAPPHNAGEMAEVARKLSEDFDFVRVDLYNISGRIHFGEMTLTPGGRPAPPGNIERNALVSRMWELNPDNDLLYDRTPWMTLAKY